MQNLLNSNFKKLHINLISLLMLAKQDQNLILRDIQYILFVSKIEGLFMVNIFALSVYDVNMLALINLLDVYHPFFLILILSIEAKFIIPFLEEFFEHNR